jgi:hypothetical protein
VLLTKLRAILSRGPAGVWRVLRNLARLLTGRWEHPADAEWWRHALARAGFRDIEVRLLEHEGGIISARRPVRTGRERRWPRRAPQRAGGIVG